MLYYYGGEHNDADVENRAQREIGQKRQRANKFAPRCASAQIVRSVKKQVAIRAPTIAPVTGVPYRIPAYSAPISRPPKTTRESNERTTGSRHDK